MRNHIIDEKDGKIRYLSRSRSRSFGWAATGPTIPSVPVPCLLRIFFYRYIFVCTWKVQNSPIMVAAAIPLRIIGDIWIQPRPAQNNRGGWGVHKSEHIKDRVVRISTSKNANTHAQNRVNCKLSTQEK